MTGCEHELGYGALCIHCEELMSPAWVASYSAGEEPNRSYYEVYWPGPRENHVHCDPWGETPRPESQLDDCIGPHGECERLYEPIVDYGEALEKLLREIRNEYGVGHD